MRAIILAAGEGSRLRPLTAQKPKPMIEVANKPILQYVVEALVANGITDLTIVVGYRRAKVQSFFENGRRFGASISYVFQESFLGTAHALAQVPFEDEEVLVLGGDNIVDAELVADLLAAKKQHANGVLLVAKASDNPTKYGVLTLDGTRVTRIEEKPPVHASEFVNTGVYALPAGFHSDLVESVKSGLTGLTYIIDALIDQGLRVTAVKSAGAWMDIVYPWDIVRITSYILAEEGIDVRQATTANVHPSAVIVGPVVLGDEAIVGPNTFIDGATSIGDNVVIGAQCVIENSVIGNDVRLGPLSILRNAVIGDGCRVGARFTGLAGPADVRVADGYHEVPDIGCIMGEDARVGGNAVTQAGAIIGNRARVANSVTVRGVVPDEGQVM